MRTPTPLALAAVALSFACGGPAKPTTTPTDTASPPPSASAPEPAAAAPVADDAASVKALDEGKRAFDAGDLAGAQAALETSVAKNGRNATAHFYLGMVHEKAGRRPNAHEAYKRALEIQPDYEEAAVHLAAMYLDATPPRAADAATVCRTTLAQKPKSATLHNSLAIALAMQGFDQEAALKEFEEAIRLNGGEPMFHVSYAHWLTVWKVKGAVPHLDAARQLVKDDYGLMASIGHELRMNGEFAACVDVFSKLIAKKDGAEVRTERALCKLGLKDDAATLADLQAAVAKEPSYAPAHYYLGGRLAMKKKWKEAAAEYEKYLQLDPQGSLAKAATERLEAAKKMMEKK